ncbi:MAG TPA: hydrogenase maturation protease [Acidimicrobiales bacterium]|nr:hydrogenase maturation protease [Acidimicrobiales bacterium]
MSAARIFVVGVGNIFLGDDGFGVEVATRMRRRPVPDGVRVEEYGIRGVHLAYALLEGGFDLVVLVDTLDVGEEPGAVSVFESELGDAGEVLPDAHDLDPASVMGLLAGLGGSVGRMLVVGCQPSNLEERIGLSPAVEAAVEEAITVVEELVQEQLSTYIGKEHRT